MYVYVLYFLQWPRSEGHRDTHDSEAGDGKIRLQTQLKQYVEGFNLAVDAVCHSVSKDFPFWILFWEWE